MNTTFKEKLDRVMTAQVAGTGDTLSSDWVDLQGFEGVEFEAAFGDITVSASITCRIQTNDTASADGNEITESTTVAFTSDGTSEDNGLVRLELYRPVKRYARFQIVRATANAAVDSVVAKLHSPRTKKITDSADVIGSNLIAQASLS